MIKRVLSKKIRRFLLVSFIVILISSTSVTSCLGIYNNPNKTQLLSKTPKLGPILKRILSFFEKRAIPFPKIPHALGERPLLLILIEFKDVPHFPKHDIEYFENFLFGDYPSVRDYYEEVSYGKFSFVNAGILGWYKSKYNLKERGSRETIVRDAFKKAAKEEIINFKQYDTNNDRILTADELDIVVCTSGISDTKPMGAYHNWELKGRKIRTWDGMILCGDHSVIQEWQSWKVCAHELGHSLMLPDFYDYTRRSQGIGIYGMMGLGNIDGTNGHHFTAWSKIKLGWIEPTVITQDGFYTVNDSETNSEAYVLIDPSHSEKEYFVIENRFRGNSYDNGTSPLPDEGIIIYHVDESVPRFLTPWTWFPWVNNVERHKMVDVECADSFSSHFKDADDLDKNKNTGDENDLWDNTVYGFNSTSVPCNSRWYDGSSNGIGVYVLSKPGKSMEVYFSVSGATP